MNSDSTQAIYMLGQLVGASRALACQTFPPGTKPILCLQNAVFLQMELAKACGEGDRERMAFLAASGAGVLVRVVELLAERDPGLIVATIEAIEGLLDG